MRLTCANGVYVRCARLRMHRLHRRGFYDGHVHVGDTGFMPSVLCLESLWITNSRMCPLLTLLFLKDGEMYYGTPWPAKQRLLVDGHGAAFRMFQHHYTTFSHHNSFWPLDTEVNPDPKNKSLNVRCVSWLLAAYAVHIVFCAGRLRHVRYNAPALFRPEHGNCCYSKHVVLVHMW